MDGGKRTSGPYFPPVGFPIYRGCCHNITPPDNTAVFGVNETVDVFKTNAFMFRRHSAPFHENMEITLTVSTEHTAIKGYSSSVF